MDGQVDSESCKGKGTTPTNHTIYHLLIPRSPLYNPSHNEHFGTDVTIAKEHTLQGPALATWNDPKWSWETKPMPPHFELADQAASILILTLGAVGGDQVRFTWFVEIERSLASKEAGFAAMNSETALEVA